MTQSSMCARGYHTLCANKSGRCGCGHHGHMQPAELCDDPGCAREMTTYGALGQWCAEHAELREPSAAPPSVG